MLCAALASAAAAEISTLQGGEIGAWFTALHCTQYEEQLASSSILRECRDMIPVFLLVVVVCLGKQERTDQVLKRLGRSSGLPDERMPMILDAVPHSKMPYHGVEKGQRNTTLCDSTPLVAT